MPIPQDILLILDKLKVTRTIGTLINAKVHSYHYKIVLRFDNRQYTMHTIGNVSDRFDTIHFLQEIFGTIVSYLNAPTPEKFQRCYGIDFSTEKEMLEYFYAAQDNYANMQRLFGNTHFEPLLNFFKAKLY